MPRFDPSRSRSRRRSRSHSRRRSGLRRRSPRLDGGQHWKHPKLENEMMRRSIVFFVLISLTNSWTPPQNGRCAFPSFAIGILFGVLFRLGVFIDGSRDGGTVIPYDVFFFPKLTGIIFQVWSRQLFFSRKPNDWYRRCPNNLKWISFVRQIPSIILGGQSSYNSSSFGSHLPDPRLMWNGGLLPKWFYMIEYTPWCSLKLTARPWKQAIPKGN